MEGSAMRPGPPDMGAGTERYGYPERDPGPPGAEGYAGRGGSYAEPRVAYDRRYEGRHQDGPGLGERASEAAHNFQRQWRTSETKPFYKTSEFMVWLFSVVSVLIAAAVVDGGGQADVLRADRAWGMVIAISAVYIISRGISKAGTKYRDDDRGYPRGY